MTVGDQRQQGGKREELFKSLSERIRDVRQGPDGALYLLTGNSNRRVLRVGKN